MSCRGRGPWTTAARSRTVGLGASADIQRRRPPAGTARHRPSRGPPSRTRARPSATWRDRRVRTCRRASRRSGSRDPRRSRRRGSPRGRRPQASSFAAVPAVVADRQLRVRLARARARRRRARCRSRRSASSPRASRAGSAPTSGWTSASFPFVAKYERLSAAPNPPGRTSASRSFALRLRDVLRSCPRAIRADSTRTLRRSLGRLPRAGGRRRAPASTSGAKQRTSAPARSSASSESTLSWISAPSLNPQPLRDHADLRRHGAPPSRRDDVPAPQPTTAPRGRNPVRGFAYPGLRVRRHEDEEPQVVAARGSRPRGALPRGRGRRPRGEVEAALVHDRDPAAGEADVDLVRRLVRVGRLALPRGEDVDVAEEPRRLEEVHLPHLLGRRTRDRGDVLRGPCRPPRATLPGVARPAPSGGTCAGGRLASWQGRRRRSSILAAGGSTRFGRDKLLLDLGGVPMLQRTVAAYTKCTKVGDILVVVGPGQKAPGSGCRACASTWSRTRTRRRG